MASPLARRFTAAGLPARDVPGDMAAGESVRARINERDSAERRKRQTLARKFREAVRLAISDPSFLADLKRVGQVKSGRRILEGGLPDDKVDGPKCISVLMSIARAVQAEVGR